MISQFFILSPKGDTIISRDYLGNVPKGASEVFFRKLKFWDRGGKDAPPVFIVDGVNYLHVKDGGLLLIATTRENVSPSVILELLQRIGGIIKDYCGLLSEEAVRKNFVLIYELLDEVVDYGYPQNSSSEALKEFVLNDPIVIRSPKRQPSSLTAGAGRGPTGVIKSVLSTTRTDPAGRRDDIFVDIVEKVSCTFNSNGYISNSQIDGSIQVKSFLTGNPPISIALNDSLAIGRREGNGGAYGGVGAHDVVMLDDCNFHESVMLHRFETERVLELVPPDGEFACMNYRSTYSFKPPFRLTATVEEDPTSGIKVLINLRIESEYPGDRKASAVEVICAMPQEVQRVSCSHDQPPKPANSQSWDWQEKNHRLVWKLKHLPGGQSHILRARATLSDGFSGSLRRGIGPINLNFTIPNHCTSRLEIRYLQIMKQEKNYSPYRWVRYVTMSNSYVIRT